MIAVAVCFGLSSSVGADDRIPAPVYDDAVLSQIGEAVLSLPEPSVPERAWGVAAEPDAASDGSEDAPDPFATELAPVQEGVVVPIPSGLKASRKAKSKARENAAYESNSARQRVSGRRALSFSSGVRAPASGLDPALQASASGLRTQGREFVYGFVLLRGRLDAKVEGKLADLGVKLLGRHDDHHKARLPVDALPAIAALPEVEWVGESTPELKSSRELNALRGVDGTAKAAPAIDRTSPIPIVVNLFEADADGSFRREIEAAGAAVGEYDAELQLYHAVATEPVLERLSALDFVLFIDRTGLNPPGHDQSTPLISADLVRPGSISYGVTRFNGAPIPVGIIDSGAMMSGPTAHMDLYGKLACGRNFTSEADGPFIDRLGHGTHVLATIAGNGAANPRFKGVAPGVGDATGDGYIRLRVAKVYDAFGNGNTDSVLMSAMDWMSLPGECNTAPVDPAPLIINFSGGGQDVGLNGTDVVSRKLDYRTWINRQLYVVCNGNGGTSGTIAKPGVAKNALAVGNVLDNGYQTVGDVKFTSSRGPTGDGRMKPNVVAPGTSITSAKAGTTNDYLPSDGCSEATPHVTGLAASLMHHYPSFQYNPALVRAHLMATALGHDGNVGKSNEYGLGRVEGYVAHWDHTNTDGWHTARHSGTVNSNGYAYGDVVVPTGTKRLVVVMTWDEPPASAGAARAVTYDIDLYVAHGTSCEDELGRCGDYFSVSAVDNVEYVVVNDPVPGTYRMRVVPQDAEPTILPWGMTAVVIRGDVLPSARVASPPAMRTYTSGPTTAQVGQLISFTVGVANDSYVASGVQIEPTTLPSGVLPLSLETTRLDGVNMSFSDALGPLTLGNIPPSWSRSVTYSFLAQTRGSKVFTYRVWSENSGEQIVTRTVNVVSGAANSDLMVTVLGTNPPAPAGPPGTKFAVTTTTYNTGTSTAAASKTRHYLSLDALKSDGDMLLTGVRSVEALDPAESVSGTVSVTTPKTAASGNYFLLACADDLNAVDEADEANNCIATDGAVVTLGQPDLMESNVSAPPATKKRGTSFTVGDEARNVGGVPSVASKTRYYLSLDATKSAGDTLLVGARSVPGLVAGATDSGSKIVKIPAATAPNTYYLLACADDAKVAAESDETNNCTASSSTITVTP